MSVLCFFIAELYWLVTQSLITTRDFSHLLLSVQTPCQNFEGKNNPQGGIASNPTLVRPKVN